MCGQVSASAYVQRKAGEHVTTVVAASASNSAAPGTLGFIVVFGLAVILVFVFRSMSKHIRKVNDAARRDEAAAHGAEAANAEAADIRADGAAPGEASTGDPAAASSSDHRRA